MPSTARDTSPTADGPGQTDSPGLWGRVASYLPQGQGVSADSWHVRHRVILIILWVHLPVLVLFGLYGGLDRWISHAHYESFGLAQTFLEGLIIALFAAIASWPRVSPRLRSAAAAVGLITCSAVLTQFSGGFIEAHFHFFVILGLLSIYEDWIPFLLAIGYVLIHHGTVGTIAPGTVYNHPAAIANPWHWAGIHAFFIASLSACLVVGWNVTEEARTRVKEHAERLEETVSLQESTMEELKASKRQLEQANEDLRHFAHAASHDLKEPVRMVVSYAQLLEKEYEDGLDDDAHEYIGYTVEGAQRLHNLVDGLLQYSRVDTRVSAHEPVDLDEVLEAVKQDLSIRIQETGATITCENLPVVNGEESQLGQVFQNLLSNALKFCPEDTQPRVRIHAEQDEDRWRIRVQDNGIGIQPEHAEKLFTIFERGQGRGDYDGQGIGLAICKKIIERHGGEIRADADVEEGAAFEITLPATELQEAQPQEEYASTPPPKTYKMP